MRKSFCNCCSVELDGHNTFDPSDLVVDMDGANIQLDYKGNVDEDFDVCKYCVLDAFTKFDDRPKPSID